MSTAIELDSADLDRPWEPRAFNVGDRVRCIPSNECRRTHQSVSTGRRFTGHQPEEYGRTGTIIDPSDLADSEEVEWLKTDSHCYVVEYDEWIRMTKPELIVVAACYAAIELEPLEDSNG